MTLSIRLDAELEQRLESAAVVAGVSKSEFVRQCLQERLAELPAGDSRRAWELGKHLFGKFGSGRTDVSQNSEQILGELFDEKRRNSR